jgi:hypothetical protein
MWLEMFQFTSSCNTQKEYLILSDYLSLLHLFCEGNFPSHKGTFPPSHLSVGNNPSDPNYFTLFRWVPLLTGDLSMGETGCDLSLVHHVFLQISNEGMWDQALPGWLELYSVNPGIIGKHVLLCELRIIESQFSAIKKNVTHAQSNNNKK